MHPLSRTFFIIRKCLLTLNSLRRMSTLSRWVYDGYGGCIMVGVWLGMVGVWLGYSGCMVGYGGCMMGMVGV